jgi:hypothetical protein
VAAIPVRASVQPTHPASSPLAYPIVAA